MNKKKYSIFLLIFLFSAITYAKKNETTQNKATQYKANKTAAIKPPALNAGEYVVFIDEAYKVFTTKTYEKFELETSCFKKDGQKDKPNCDAYKFAQVKPKSITLKHEGLNNFAAIHCADITGKNLIALDADRKEFNFCFFKDGSMVNSWSVYFKYNPVPVIK